MVPDMEAVAPAPRLITMASLAAADDTSKMSVEPASTCRSVPDAPAMVRVLTTPLPATSLKFIVRLLLTVNWPMVWSGIFVNIDDIGEELLKTSLSVVLIHCLTGVQLYADWKSVLTLPFHV